MPISTGIISPVSSNGINIVLPVKASTKFAIGITKKLEAIPKPHIQPIAGLQPATNKDLCAASVLFTSNCPFASSCAWRYAIVDRS